MLVALLLGTSYAQVELAGRVTQSTSWRAADGPFIVTADLTIPQGVVLDIEAGTHVYMAGGANLIIDGGSVRASGDAEAPIVVTALAKKSGNTPTKGAWGRWIFKASAATSHLNFVQFEYGKGLEVKGAPAIFNQLQLRHHQGAAIRADAAASLSGAGNLAEENDLDAVLITAGVITGNVNWSLRGIPYLLESGELSVGTPPQLTALSGPALERGRSAEYVLSGSRLAGIAELKTSDPAIGTKLLSQNSDGSGRVELSAPLDAKLGKVDLQLLADAGEARLEQAVSVVARLPRLNSVQPSRVYVGQGTLPIQLSGDTFSSATETLFSGQLLSSQPGSDTQMGVTLPNQLKAGNFSLQVRHADPDQPGQYLASASLPFLVERQPTYFAQDRVAIDPGAVRNVSFRLSYPAHEAISFQLSSSNPGAVSVPAELTVPKGASERLVALSAQAGGEATITVSRDGYTTASLVAIVDTQQRLQAQPTILVAEPGGAKRSFLLTLSRAESSPRRLTLQIMNPAIATLSTSEVEIPAGSLSAEVLLNTLAAGRTELRVLSADLGELRVPVLVSAEAQAVSTTYAEPLVVQVQGGDLLGPGMASYTSYSPALRVFVDAVEVRESDPRFTVFSAPVGLRIGVVEEASMHGELYAPSLRLANGCVFSGIAPQTVVPGTTVELTLFGANLAVSDLQARVLPANAGLTVATPIAAPDGRSAKLLLSVDPASKAAQAAIWLNSASCPVDTLPGSNLLPIGAPAAN